MCLQCRGSENLRDCEYGNLGPTTPQLLEEQIARVSARINEIERRDYRAPSSSTIPTPFVPHLSSLDVSAIQSAYRSAC